MFTSEEENTAFEILDSIRTAHEATEILLHHLESGEVAQFTEIDGLLDHLLTTIERASAPYREKQDNIMLPLSCRSAKDTLRAVRAHKGHDPKYAEMKLKFELLPILEEAYMQFYYWACVNGHPERESRYYNEEIFELASNPYMNTALETGLFKFDVTFLVIAYNHLEYTKKCVESLLQNIPNGLSCELILWDNGSTDGTVAYFESKRPTKLIESRVNWAIGLAPFRAFEGKYFITISNDVIVLPGAIENMLACARSDEKIARVVPTTPNVSNLQTIQATYGNEAELWEFARWNNKQDPFRWEQRTRLCDPISLNDGRWMYSRAGVCTNGYLNRNANMFPDDRAALLCRRAGYKLYLAKDAYCYHFGSVTLKDEIQKQDEQKFYMEGRQGFFDWFGIDPWGTGFCYDPVFLERVVGDCQGYMEILGINCGMGSNSLKIKEQVKEYCHNTDCTLFNITDDERFVPDLKGIGEEASLVRTIREFKSALYGRSFRYIVWETPFLTQYKFSTLLELCLAHLTPEGMLLIKWTEQSKYNFRECSPEWIELGKNWIALAKRL